MKNLALLFVLLFIQNYNSKCDKFVNPDGGEWVTIDSVLAYYNDTVSNGTSYFFNLACYDSLNCIGHYGDFMSASTYSRIRKTTDGGNSWFDIRVDTRPPYYPNKRFIFYPEKDLIVIGCDSGYVLRSTDGGKNWDFSKKVTSLAPNEFQLNSMYMKGNVGIMHYTGLSNAFITSDGGENWTKMQFNTNPQLKYPGATFSIIDANTIIMSSWVNTVNDTSMYYFKTTNRGNNWSLIRKIPKSENYYSFFSFINENLGYSRYLNQIHKSKYQDGTSDTVLTAIFKTTDGGFSWNKIYETIDPWNGFGKHNFYDSLNIISTNSMGGYIKSSDGGQTWEKSQYFTYDGEVRNDFCFTNTFMSPTKPIIGAGPLILKYVGKNTSVDNNISEKQEILIFPNPTNDFITIQFSNKELQPFAAGDKVQIFDVLGIEIMSVGTGLDLSTQRIDVSNLPAGVYFIRFGNMVEKFVKI